jgi:hypothetical protein
VDQPKRFCRQARPACNYLARRRSGHSPVSPVDYTRYIQALEPVVAATIERALGDQRYAWQYGTAETLLNQEQAGDPDAPA